MSRKLQAHISNLCWYFCVLMIVCAATGCATTRVNLLQGKCQPPPNMFRSVTTHDVPVIVKYYGAEWLPVRRKGLGSLMEKFVPLGSQQYHYPFGSVAKAAAEKVAYKYFSRPKKITGESLFLEIHASKCVLRSGGVNDADSACEFEMNVHYTLTYKGQHGKRKVDLGSGEYHAMSNFNGKDTPRAVWQSCYESLISVMAKFNYSPEIWQITTEMKQRSISRTSMWECSGTIRLVNLSGEVIASCNFACKDDSNEFMENIRSVAQQAIGNLLDSGNLKQEARIAVLPLKAVSRLAQDDGYGHGISGYMETALVNSGRAQVVTRSHLFEVMGERDISTSDFVEDSKLRTDLIKIKAVDYLVVGDVQVLKKDQDTER